MIQKLKIKFIVLALTSIFVLLTVIVAGMNLLNYKSVVDEADEILSLLSQNQGKFPDFGENNKNDWLPPGMSPEIPYETRFFSVLLTESGTVIRAETSQIFTIDNDTASQYAQDILRRNNNKGFVDNFRYTMTQEGNNIRITFLDWGRKLDSFENFITTSIGMSLLGFSLISFIVIFFSQKFIRPVAESYEKQKRFITDAGHEIKTPLTIISANVDVLKMDIGENECLEDIRQQTKRLTGLTNDLVYLARMEETAGSLQMIDFPVSEIVFDTAAPFKTLAQTQNKELSFQIQPMLSMRGNDKAFSQLVSIFLDNAFKYSPEGSRICLKLEKQGRKLVLSVSNPSVVNVTIENLRHIFDRFYRTDLSRNSATGGHGIGLSMAQAIVNAHGGKISVGVHEGNTFFITAIFSARVT